MVFKNYYLSSKYYQKWIQQNFLRAEKGFEQ